MNRTQTTAATFALIAGLVAASPAEGQEQGQRRGAPPAPPTGLRIVPNQPTETVATSNNKFYVIDFAKPVLGNPNPLEGNSIKSIREIPQAEAMKEAFTPSATRSPGVFQLNDEAGKAALEKMIQDALKAGAKPAAPAQGSRRADAGTIEFDTLA